MTEKEYKEYIYEKASKVIAKKDLDALLEEVDSDEELDYGKIIYAICGCMFATYNYIDRGPNGGITGMQASFIAWEMIRKFIHDSNVGMRILDYENMLYPQYECDFKTISKKTWEKLQKQAKTNLEEYPDAHPAVIKHWKRIVKGKVPFGYKVVKE